MKIISSWLKVKDINGELYSWLLCLKRNKVKVARQLLTDTKLREIKPEVTKEKI